MAKREFTKDPVWLVMGMSLSGNIELYSVDTEQWIANAHRKMIQKSIEWESGHFKNVVRVWLERRETNHMYGISMIDKDLLSPMFTAEEMYLLGYDEKLIEMVRPESSTKGKSVQSDERGSRLSNV